MGVRLIFRSLKNLLAIIRTPILPETRTQLRQKWAALPESLRTDQQMYGRHGNGCGATIGVMPRCDFACRGCYLGGEANRAPRRSVDEIKAQMRCLRPVLGKGGNLQITDGEVTLRPEPELIELIRYARALGLIPMLMTHGDTYRRRPGLLERLMTDAGLVETGIHIDTTQRGRTGTAFRYASHEAELNPLRDEFARMIRNARKTTGLPLSCATTMTVTRDNLAGVPDVVRWLVRNADAFHMVSFQPLAHVGRTEADLDGVSVDALWEKIAEGLDEGAGKAGSNRDRLERGVKWLGHEACNRFVHGLVITSAGRSPSFHPVRDRGDPGDGRVFNEFFARFGGISFRQDSNVEMFARILGILVHAPVFVAKNALPYTLHWLRRIDADRPRRAALGIISRTARVHTLAIVSHHFMDQTELDTHLGRERLANCVFHVPVAGELVSMCEVNATGIRDRYYGDSRTERNPVLAAANPHA